MRKFKLNQTVYIPEIGKVGTVKKIDDNGQVIEVDVNGTIINVVGLILEAYTIIKAIWLAIKSIFKKRR